MEEKIKNPQEQDRTNQKTETEKSANPQERSNISDAKGKTYSRLFEVNREAINPDERTIELSFSSEIELERWYGIEVLDHSKKSVRMDRINSGAPLLLNHNADAQVGVVERAWIDGKNKRGKALVRFGKSTFAEEIFTDVRDGIRRNVSVSYINYDMVLEEQKGDDLRYRVMDWEPIEISVVATPADFSVGIGRSLEIDKKNLNAKEIKKMDEIKTEDLTKEVRAKELSRIKEIRAIGSAFKMEKEAETAIEAGTSDEEFRKEVMRKLAEQKETIVVPKIEVGQNRSELRPFHNMAEFLFSVHYNRADSRLSPLYRAPRNDGERALSMGVGTAGGYALPDQFRDTLLQVGLQEAHVRPRAQVIPPGDPPDAKITIPALDQTTAKGVYGGVTISWIAEGGTKPETQFYLQEISLEPKEVAGHMNCTDKLLRNWGAASSLIERQFRLAVIGSEDTAFLTGDGVGKPLGVLNVNNPGAITVNRNTASSVKWADLYGMYKNFYSASGVWLISKSCVDQFISMVDAASNLVWQTSARDSMPQAIFGMPIIWSTRVPTLGTRGDVSLLDLSYYLVKDGSGPIFESTNAVYFTRNITTFKITWNVDGQGWLKTPIPYEYSTSSTASPFVVLA